MNQLRNLILGGALLIAAVVPAEAWAQACLGIPTGGGQAAVQTAASYIDGTRGYGLGVAYDTAGPWTVLGSAGFVDVEDTSVDAWSGSAGVAAEMRPAGLSVCPTAMAGYIRSEKDEEFDASLSVWSGNLGVSVGKRFQSGNRLAFLPYVQPSLMVARLALEIGDEKLEDTDEAFAMTVGGTLSGYRFFGGASVSATTFEDSETSYGVHVGMTL